MAGGAPQLGGVPFAEAIDFFRAKLRVPTAAWTDLWQDMHSRGFMVAGAASDALLKDFQDSLLKAMERGLTLEDFRKDFDRIVATHGWSYKGSRGWRSRVIFQTNMRTAAAAGRWAQIQRLKAVRPFIRYVAVMDARTRPLHRAWHGTVLPVEDPWWDTHFPPCGWNCRCTVQSLSERDLKRFGYQVSPKAPPSPLVNHVVNTPAGPVVVQAPVGIDPGFAYNPGKTGSGGPPPGGLGGAGPPPSPAPPRPIPPRQMLATEALKRPPAREEDFADAAPLRPELRDELARDLYRRGRRSSAPEDLEALDVYATAAKDMNKRLRAGTLDQQEWGAIVSAIDAAIGSFRLPVNLATWRGMQASDFTDYIAEMDPGDVVYDPAFVSTSLSRRIARRSFSGSGGLLIKLLVPQGAAFYPMGAVREGRPFAAQQELTLARGATLRMIARRAGYVLMELVLP